MNTWAYNILLGVVQGVTEFLPISSDGHLAVAGFLVGLAPPSLASVVLLHAGTWLATLLVFRREVTRIVRGVLNALRTRGARAPSTHVDGPSNHGDPSVALLVRLVAASVPTALIGLLLKPYVEPWANQRWVVGVGFLLSAVAVLSTRIERGARTTPHGRTEIPSLRAALLIGVAQGLAVAPGLSRSASTIACGRLAGLSGPAAFGFSFLLSLPAVGGAVLLEALHERAFDDMGAAEWTGAAVAFGVGVAALLGLQHIVRRGRFWWFALYLVPLGVWLVASHG
jgi:undecaprenyl-diphosphatase